MRLATPPTTVRIAAPAASVTVRKVADVDRHVELVSDALQLMLPRVRPVAVAAPGVGGDEYLARLGVALGANSTPPGLDGPHRKDRGVSWSRNSLATVL